jgi:hypothetical protein
MMLAGSDIILVGAGLYFFLLSGSALQGNKFSGERPCLECFFYFLLYPTEAFLPLCKSHYSNDDGLHCDDAHCIITFVLASASHHIKLGENLEILLGRQAQYVISKPYIIFLYVFSP